MQQEVKMINIEKIAEFPEQKDIYGTEVLDNEFVASIDDMGIKNPLTLTETNKMVASQEDNKAKVDEIVRSKKQYVCISGHRRIQAALKVGLKTVPAIVENYKNYEEASLIFLILNKQREKTERQRRAEFMRTKQILGQVGKLRQKHSSYAVTNYVDSEFFRILKNYKIDDDSPLDSVSILKEVTGYNKYRQDMNTVVYDEGYLEKQLQRMQKKGIKPEAETLFYEHVEQIRRLCDNGDISLNKAATNIKEMIKETNRILRKEPKTRVAGKKNNASRASKKKASKKKAIKELRFVPVSDPDKEKITMHMQDESGAIGMGVQYDGYEAVAYVVRIKNQYYKINKSELL